MTYEQAEKTLSAKRKDSCKLENNTRLERRDGHIAVRLHETDIIALYPDGSARVDVAEFKTPTTKDRLNKYLPHGWQIHQRRGQWFWSRYSHTVSEYKTETRTFTNGDRIKPDGKLEAQATAESEAETKAMAKRILKFAALCAASLPLPKPGEGDCMYCLHGKVTSAEDPKGEKHDNLGDAFGATDHLESHMEEGYVVPSLVYHALREARCGDLIVGAAFADDAKTWPVSIARDYVKRAVAKYLKRRLGIACGGVFKTQQTGFAVR